jgi:hypothetical protein
MNLDRLTSTQEFDFPLQSGNKDLKGKIKKSRIWLRIHLNKVYCHTQFLCQN